MSRARAGAQGDLLKLVHVAMRGRYLAVTLLGLLCAAGGAAGGWLIGRPLYRSEGLVRIASSLPPVMAETDQNRTLSIPAMDTFIQSQRTMITSRRVLDMATQNPIWKAGRRVPPDPQELARRLKVDTRFRNECILISVTDEDAGFAGAAVTSIINAYSELYNSHERQMERQRIGTLEELQNTLNGRIEQLTNQVRTISQEYGTSKLDIFFEAAAARVTKLQAALFDIRIAQATAISEQPDPSKPHQPITAMTIEQIASSDPVMRRYVEDRGHLEESLEQMKMRGLGPEHKDVKFTNAALERATARVSQYAEMYRTFHAATMQNLGDARPGRVVTEGKSREVLKANEASLATLLKEADQELKTIGNKKLELERLDVELTRLREEYAKLASRMEVLRAEGSLGGRLTVVSSGEVPSIPDTDPRPRLAAAGAGGGLFLPAGLVLLVSALRRRYRFSDEMERDVATRTTLLGILPHLKSRSASEEQMLHAAHCVHQIRVSLRAGAASEGPTTYLITSAAAGEGKTSVTMALGLSLSAAGIRTILVDGDWIGQALTQKLKSEDCGGLREALAAKNIDPFVRNFAGLSVLTAGRVNASDACTLSAAGIRSLLEKAKREYDVVLIDTGPILGSVEASVIAQEVDGVIFTIARGQDRLLVERALRRLNSLGVDFAGVIFNQAHVRDFHHSTYGSVTRSSSGNHRLPPPQAPTPNGLEAFGPLVQAVLSHVPNPG